ncbi:MAG: hypothetical protein AB7F86_01445 [Bdellovibrionales bacterium]
MDVVARRWFLTPSLDLLFVCGGMVWILAGLTGLMLGLGYSYQNSATFTIFLLVSVNLLANSHTMATFVRLYHSSANRQSYFEYGFLLILPVLGLTWIGARSETMAALFVRLYGILVGWHYARQVYGLCLLYGLKQGYQIPEVVRLSWQLLVWAVSLKVAVTRMIYPDTLARVLNISALPTPILPFEVFTVAKVFLILVAAACVVLIFWFGIKRAEWPPLPAVVLLSSMTLFFLSEGLLDSILWYFIPAFFHGSQYIAVSGVFHMNESGARNIQGVSLSRIVTYLLALVGGGILIYYGIPYFMGWIGFEQRIALAAVFCVVNFHHFLTDGAIWRLRTFSIRKWAVG